jgi:hypothetical protein
MGFGVDSFVETASAAVVGWRLYSEVSGHADEAVPNFSSDEPDASLACCCSVSRSTLS